jgi:hypothetical protein
MDAELALTCVAAVAAAAAAAGALVAALAGTVVVAARGVVEIAAAGGVVGAAVGALPDVAGPHAASASVIMPAHATTMCARRYRVRIRIAVKLTRAAWTQLGRARVGTLRQADR